MGAAVGMVMKGIEQAKQSPLGFHRRGLCRWQNPSLPESNPLSACCRNSPSAAAAAHAPGRCARAPCARRTQSSRLLGDGQVGQVVQRHRVAQPAAQPTIARCVTRPSSVQTSSSSASAQATAGSVLVQHAHRRIAAAVAALRHCALSSRWCICSSRMARALLRGRTVPARSSCRSAATPVEVQVDRVRRPVALLAHMQLRQCLLSAVGLRIHSRCSSPIRRAAASMSPLSRKSLICGGRCACRPPGSTETTHDPRPALLAQRLQPRRRSAQAGGCSSRRRRPSAAGSRPPRVDRPWRASTCCLAAHVGHRQRRLIIQPHIQPRQLVQRQRHHPHAFGRCGWRMSAKFTRRRPACHAALPCSRLILHAQTAATPCPHAAPAGHERTLAHARPRAKYPQLAGARTASGQRVQVRQTSRIESDTIRPRLQIVDAAQRQLSRAALCGASCRAPAAAPAAQPQSPRSAPAPAPARPAHPRAAAQPGASPRA